VDYGPDNLTNTELGWKTNWVGRCIQWEGAAYAPEVIANSLTTNRGSYLVRGIETGEVLEGGLTVEVRAAWNHNELVHQVTYLWTDGVPIDFSTLQTAQDQHLTNPVPHPEVRLVGVLVQSTAFSPLSGR
jgi:hypothetical protein